MPALRIPGFGLNLPDGPSVLGDTTTQNLTVLGTLASNAPTIFSATNISADLNIPAGYNAASVGPITIDDGATVTIADNSTWSII